MAKSNDEHVTTYWGKSSFGIVDNPPWELEWKPFRGYFAISKRQMKTGDEICTEYPTTWTKAWHPFSSSETEQIEKEISNLHDGMAQTYDLSAICWCMNNYRPFLVFSLQMKEPHFLQ